MSLTRDAVLNALARVALPDGGDIVSRDLVRALTVEGGSVRFVLEAPDPDAARRMEPVRQAAEGAVRAMDGVSSVSAVLTAHGPAPKAPAPSLKIGGHPTPQSGPQPVAGVNRIIAIASGKGASASPRCHRTLRWRWPGRGGASACLTPISTGRRSPG